MRLPTILLTVLALILPAFADEPPTVADRRIKAGPYTLSGPYTHDNLTVYLVHGPGAMPGRSYLTLDEALIAKKAIVHETGDVNQLAVENLSPDQDLYLSAGDIVKGGKQDRTIGQDLIVKAGSGKMPVGAFCVEQGRWRARGNEDLLAFSPTTQPVVGKDLKLAARLRSSQTEVWQAVADNQRKLAANTGASVQSLESATSLQLTLENAAVVASSDKYIDQLATILAQHRDVIGCAFAINGKPNSIEVFANPQLFRKLWPKLLKSAAVEAVAELKPNERFDPVTTDALQSTIAAAEQGTVKGQEPNDRTTVITSDAKQAVLFETRDTAVSEVGAYVRRSYIAK